jgi:hypothetical protein
VRECPVTEAQRAELMANLKRWGKVRTWTTRSGHSAAGKVRKGYYRAQGMDPAEWEVRCSATDDDGSALYARYLGPRTVAPLALDDLTHPFDRDDDQ